VQTTNLGNGMWHYEYVAYNHDLDRQVKEFSIQVPVGTNVQNIGFRDIDQDGTNQWTNSFTNGVMTWTTTNNPLMYSSAFNFRFDADMPPMNSSTVLNQLKPGSAGALSAATRGPLVLTPVSSYTVVNGTLLSGNLQSLALRDGDYLSVTPILTSSLLGTGIETSSTAPAGTFTALHIGAVTSNTLLAGQAVQKVYLWNWGTSAWDVVDTRPSTSTDKPTIVKVTSNPMSYINGSTREVRARVMQASLLGDSSQRWTLKVDQVGLQYE
jgi:hypothetical protein